MDPLGLYRSLVATKPSDSSETPLPIPTTSSDSSTAETQRAELENATHLYFPAPVPQCVSLESKTRFVLNEEEVNLRSVHLVYTMRNENPQEYVVKFNNLSAQLSETQSLRQLTFVERIELVTWIEGSDSSDLVKPLEIAADTAAASGTVPVVAGTGAAVTQTSINGRPVKVIDARLQAIYNGERKMGDRNTILRGIKPTDFSHVRKYRDLFMPKKSKDSKSGQLPTRSIPPSMPGKPAVNSSKRVDPIIMLSPSASSLLRMSNIKTFLDTGLFVPFDHPQLATMSAANLLHLTRPLRQISDKPFRFILVDSPDQFKTEYWERVVAVFTTGQTWQFRGYKWREPQELFSHVLGIYVGEKGLPVPAEVKSWGSNVKTFLVDRWDERSHGVSVDHDARMSRRWKDREVVEEMWRTIESSMKGNALWKR